MAETQFAACREPPKVLRNDIVTHTQTHTCYNLNIEMLRIYDILVHKKEKVPSHIIKDDIYIYSCYTHNNTIHDY